MKKKRIIVIAFLTMLLLVLSSCNKEQEKVTVTYIIDDEVYETCELKVGEKATNLEVNEKDNLVFTGWKLRNKDYDFSEIVTKDIKLKGSFVTYCEANGHTVVTDSKIDATCAETGLTEGSHCSVCNKVLKEQYSISKSLVHNYSEPTCLTPATCTVCGKQKNDKLGEHKVVEANYEEGSHCSVCNEVYSDKLLYEVVDLEYEIKSEKEMLTIEEYTNIKDSLVVYGILNDGTKVKLNNEDVEVYYDKIKVDETAYPLKYIPLIYIKYNNFVKQTNKLYYGILTLMDIDFTKIESAGYYGLNAKDEFGYISMLSSDFYDYISEFGYDKFTREGFFEEKGWEYHFETWQTDLGPKYSEYFTKDNYRIVVYFRIDVFDNQYIYFDFDILNNNE